jgi:hypothetical protein
VGRPTRRDAVEREKEFFSLLIEGAHEVIRVDLVPIADEPAARGCKRTRNPVGIGAMDARSRLENLMRSADRLDELADTSSLMGDEPNAERLHVLASHCRLRAMAMLDD